MDKHFTNFLAFNLYLDSYLLLLMRERLNKGVFIYLLN